MYCTCTVYFSSDIDGDGIISRKDMCDMLDMLTDRPMIDDKKNQIINGVTITIYLSFTCKV